MNKEDRSNFLTLIESKNPTLLNGIDPAAVTDEQIMALVGEAMSPPPQAGAPVATSAPGGGPQLTQRELQALCEHYTLTYRTSERVTETRADGTTHRVWQPRLRPLEASDILSHRVNGRSVVIVTADGQKRTLARAGS